MKTFTVVASIFVFVSIIAHAQQSQGPVEPDSDSDLTSELARVTALSHGSKPAESTGTRGGGNLSIVDMKSLENLILSGKLNQMVKEAAIRVDPSKSFFSEPANEWQMMLNEGMLDDISKSPYIFSETGDCSGSIDQGTGASTDDQLLSPVCWDLQHLISNRDSMDTLVILGIRAEARHFRLGYNSTRLIAEMAARLLRSK